MLRDIEGLSTKLLRKSWRKKLFQVQQIFIANIAVIQSWRRWIRFHQNNIGQAKDDQDQRLRGHLEFLMVYDVSEHDGAWTTTNLNSSDNVHLE